MLVRTTQRALLLLTMLAPLAIAVGATLAPPPTGPVAAFFPPWWAPAKSYASAVSAGPVLRFGAFRFIVIVWPMDRGRLAAHGAWLLLDPRAPGCTAA